jgi:hypothetical protein
MKGNKTVIGLVIVVLLHAAITIAHGSAHTAAQVNLGPAGLAFVIAVIEIGPLAGLVWMRTNRRSGARLIALAMMGSLVFGVVNHFIIPGADRVDYVHGPSHALFETTAILLAITETLGVVLGIGYGWGSLFSE